MSNEKKLVVKLNEKPFKDGEIAPDQDAVLITDGTDRNKLKRVLLENLVAGGGGGDGTSWEFINFDPNIGKEGTPQDPDPYIPENEDTIAAVRLTPDDKGGTLYKFNPLGDGTPFNPYWHHLFDISVESGTTWEVVAFDPNDQDGQGNHYVPGNEDTIVFVDPVIGTLYDGNVYKYNPDDGAHGKPFWTLLFNVNSGGAGGAPLIFGFGDPNDESVDGNDGSIFVDKGSGIFYKYYGVASRWEAQLRSAESLILFETSDPDEYTKVPVKEDTLILNTSNGKLFKYDFTEAEWVNVYTFNTGGGGGDFNLEGATINGKGLALENAAASGAGLAIGEHTVAAGPCSIAVGAHSKTGRVIRFNNPQDPVEPTEFINIEIGDAFNPAQVNTEYDLVLSYRGDPLEETRVLEAGTYSIIDNGNGTYSLRVPHEFHSGKTQISNLRGLHYNAEYSPSPVNLTGGSVAVGIGSEAEDLAYAFGLASRARHLGSMAVGVFAETQWPFSFAVGGGTAQTSTVNLTCTTTDETPKHLGINFEDLELSFPFEFNTPGVYRLKGSIIASSGGSSSVYDVNAVIYKQDGKSNPPVIKVPSVEEVLDELSLGTSPTLSISSELQNALEINCTGKAATEIEWAGCFTVHFLNLEDD